VSQHRAFVAFGGNIGDVVASFHHALDRLEAMGSVTSRSALYRTAPVGGPAGQPDHRNAVVVVRTDIEPGQLMTELLRIEAERDRVRRVRWGPRTLDLDLLDVDDTVLDEPGLTLPHPRLWDRAFVLVPLADVAPDWVHPVEGISVRQRLSQIDQTGVMRESADW
jgi:2-amino-4-hydroxy-6-hydroxymethyldihydropteridine diphosphokinase